MARLPAIHPPRKGIGWDGVTLFRPASSNNLHRIGANDSATGAHDASNGRLAASQAQRFAAGTTTLPSNAALGLGSAGTWQFLCLAEIGNFASLRRQLGRSRANELSGDISEQILRHVRSARIAIIARATVEIVFEGDSIDELLTALVELTAEFDRSFDLGGGESYRLEMHFGAAASPGDSSEEVRLAEEAESALEQARHDASPVVRDLSAGTPAFDRLTLTRDLPAAIAKGEMFLQYQPKVHVRRQEITGAEALVRWQHPTRGLILPGDFITLAEEAREIAVLTLWALDKVIADQRLLAEDGHDITIFINISGQLLADARFVSEACGKVRDSGARIGFEITETSVIRDPQSAIRNLRAFADVGITIAIDDYGAGLSSLAYLKQLPARELKIDKMFVVQLTSSNRDPLIVRSTIDLAHALEMEVTAEDVETQAAMALLSVMGCDMVQGYLISRPVSIDVFREFMRDDLARQPIQPDRAMFRRPASFWRSA